MGDKPRTTMHGYLRPSGLGSVIHGKEKAKLNVGPFLLMGYYLFSELLRRMNGQYFL
jgi:hypothetical protein